MAKGFSVLLGGVFAFSVLGCQEERAQELNHRMPFAKHKSDVSANAVDDPRSINVVYDLKCVRVRGDTMESESAVLASSIEVYSRIEETHFALDKVADPCVIGISNKKEFMIGAVDPLASTQHHLNYLKKSDLDKFMNRSVRAGRETIFAVIDTGVDLIHEDLSANIWVNKREIVGNGIDDDSNGYIDDINGYNFASRSGVASPELGGRGVDHGTHVAGLIAAVEGNQKGGKGVRGINVRIMSLNVFGANNGASIANIENAIRYAADNGAHIINMSLGALGTSASMESAMIYALQKGSVVVVAAGNNARQLSEQFFVSPASYGSIYDGIITVGSLDSKTAKVSEFSNRGSKYVEVMAPGSEDSMRGVGLFSTLIGNKYGRMQGTSMAAPVVAGALGYLRSYLRQDLLSPSLLEREFLKFRRLERNKKNQVLDGGVLDLATFVKAPFEKFSRILTGDQPESSLSITQK